MQTVRFYAGGNLFHVTTIPSRTELITNLRLLSEWVLPDTIDKAELITVDHAYVVKSKES